MKELFAKLANRKFQDVIITQVGRKKTGRGGQESTRTELNTRDLLDGLKGKKEAVKKDRKRRGEDAK